MTEPSNLFKLRQQITWLDGWQASLEQVIAEAQKELAVVHGLREGAIQARDELLSSSVSGSPRRITVDDIKGCRTQREVLRLVAELNSGPAHLGNVSQLVVDARMTRAEKDSVRSTLHHYVSDNPDDWGHMGNGWVWLLEFGPVPAATHQEGDVAAGQVEQPVGVSFSTGPGDVAPDG